MNFVSFSFVGLFLLVCAYRYTLGRVLPRRVYFAVLLLASLLFYIWHVPAYLAIILTSTCVDYFAGLAIGGGQFRGRARTAVLAASLFTNLALLGFFKYADFFLATSGRVFAAVGREGSVPQLDLILPMGISFYTFQSMSYTIDVYRGFLPPLRSFPRFLLYVSFFPQLMAGPIVRAREFLYQFDRPRRPSVGVAFAGAYFIVRGFFYKMVVADNLGTIVDRYWATAAVPGASALLVALVAVLFSCQIFGDFAGYSSIARGLGYLLGFRLPVNFRSPYIATSFQDFWTRWHISLSTWLRDYLYVPLGGNRGGRVRTLCNLMIVMLLGGLWHGAALPFILWGGLHGAALVVERLLGLRRARERSHGVLQAGWYVVVQLVVLAGWVVFRAESVEQAVDMFVNVSTLHPLAWSLRYLPADLPIWLCGLGVAPIVLHHVRAWVAERFPGFEAGTLERALVTGAMAYAVLTCYGAGQQFIYFQF